MKKKQIFIAVMSVGFLASCNTKPQPVVTKDLTPVEDAVGMERAEKILEKELEVLDAVEPETLFKAIPHNFALEDISVLNATRRGIAGKRASILEIVYDNYVNSEVHADFDLDKIYLHTTAISNPISVEEELLPLNYNIEAYFYYDKSSKLEYELYSMDGMKYGFVSPTETTEEEAKDDLAYALWYYSGRSPLSFLDVTPVGYYLFPAYYLMYLTDKNSETQEYYALEAWNAFKETIHTDEDKEQYFSWQFGSDGDDSLSVRNDFKYYASVMTGGGMGGMDIRMDGYIEGPDATTLFNPMNAGGKPFIPLFDQYPNLVVLKNNILSSAEYIANFDLESVETLGFKKGALFAKGTKKRNIDLSVDGANVVYPDLTEYTFIDPEIM